MMELCSEISNIFAENFLGACLYEGKWIHFETPGDLKRDEWQL